MKRKKASKHDNSIVACERKFKDRDVFVDKSYCEQLGYVKVPKENKQLWFESLGKKFPLHLVSDKPLIMNVDNFLRKGGMKYSLFGKLPISYQVNRIRMFYSASIVIRNANSEWEKVVFKNTKKTQYIIKLNTDIDTSHFRIDSFPFDIGRVSKNGLVFSVICSLGHEESKSWPVHFHFYLKKNNRVENRRHLKVMKAHVDCFMQPPKSEGEIKKQKEEEEEEKKKEMVEKKEREKEPPKPVISINDLEKELLQRYEDENEREELALITGEKRNRGPYESFDNDSDQNSNFFNSTFEMMLGIDTETNSNLQRNHLPLSSQDDDDDDGFSFLDDSEYNSNFL